MTRALCTPLLALALALALAAGAAAAMQPDEALAALRSAVAKHPDDPALSWALADALEAADRPAEATDWMQRHLARWPDRPDAAWRALGRCAYRAGRSDAAIAALTRALERDARDAEAQLYLGLALQQRGEKQRAEAHFEAAAEHDAGLAPQALLLSGLSRITRGDARGGQQRLERVLAIAPDSASARDARALLDATPAPASRSPFRIESSAGISYDSNVTLEGEGDFPGAGSPQDDVLFDFGTVFAWRPALGGEGRFVELGVRYDRSDYVELSEFSEQAFQGSLSGQLPLHPRLALRLDAAGGYGLLENDPYFASGALRPSLLAALGRRGGLLRIYAAGERLDYEDEPLFDSLERSGWAYGGGAEHLFPFATERQAWLAWGGSYQRRDTDAQRDALGFAGAYDCDRWRASLRSVLSLPFEIRVSAGVYFDAELYANRNVIDSLTEDPDSPERRRDFVWSSRLSLRRPLYRGVELELHAQFTDRDSNVDLYGYQRALTGLRLHAALP